MKTETLINPHFYHGKRYKEVNNMLDMLLAKKRSPDRREWLEQKGNLAEI